MAEEKKPKIDLKARLGKAGGAGAGATPAPIPDPRGSVPPPAIPAPVVGGAAPSGRASVPPPMITPGIPVPPFAQPARPVAAAPAAPPPKAQEIKVDVGAEVVEAQKKNQKFIGIAGVVGVLLGVAIGFNFGAGSTKKGQDEAARQGAAEVAKSVDESNAKIKLLGEKLKAASDSMKAKKFPETFAADLGAINIPFDGDKIAGKGVGRYDQKTVSLLFQYMADVAALNARKDALKSLFGGQKKAITETLEAADKPQVRYTLVLIKAPKGAVASIAPIADPFALGGDWPKEYKMQNLITKEVQPITRYDTGEPFSTKDKRIGIPIEPDSLNAAFPNDISGRVLSELTKTVQLLAGTQGAGEDDDKPGVMKTGEVLSEQLKKYASAKLPSQHRWPRGPRAHRRRSTRCPAALLLRGH
jgi:hypothetical protein